MEPAILSRPGPKVARALSVESVEAVARRPGFWVRLFARMETQGECLIWTGGVNKYGYGTLRFGFPKRVNFLVHRLAWVRLRGSLDEGEDLLHSCDTPRCGNPWHMRKGTQAENNADMKARGRYRGPFRANWRVSSGAPA